MGMRLATCCSADFAGASTGSERLICSGPASDDHRRRRRPGVRPGAFRPRPTWPGSARALRVPERRSEGPPQGPARLAPVPAGRRGSKGGLQGIRPRLRPPLADPVTPGGPFMGRVLGIRTACPFSTRPRFRWSRPPATGSSRPPPASRRGEARRWTRRFS